MSFYDQELDPDPWNWEGDFDPAWDWPRIPEGPVPGVLHDPCPLGCTYGAAEFGDGFWFTCPVCDGSGLGGIHKC